MTGRMQVRILQVRDRVGEVDGSVTQFLRGAAALARGAPFTGGGLGTSAQERTARDIAVLKAYNRALARKGCASFDLEKELQPQPGNHMPVPTIEPIKPQPETR